MTLAILWGPSFLFIKIAIAEIGPVTLAALRIGGAALLLNTYLAAVGKGCWPRGVLLIHIFIVGFFSQALPFTLINWGEQHIDSGLAAILNGLTPLSAIVLAHFSTTDDSMSPGKIIGALSGLTGLLILIYPEIIAGIGGSFLGIVAVVVAAVSYGFGAVYARKFLKGTSVIQTTSSQLMIAAAYLVPLSIGIEGLPSPAQLSWPAIGSILGLASTGTAVAFILFYYLIENVGPSYATYVTYIVPLFAVGLGVAFLNEPLSPWIVAGGVLIILGAMIANKSLTINFPNIQKPVSPGFIRLLKRVYNGR